MKLEARPTVALEVAIRLTEAEVGALDALAGYGVDQFIEHFYTFLGKAYMEKYEGGLRSFLDGASGLSILLERARKAREAFNA